DRVPYEGGERVEPLGEVLLATAEPVDEEERTATATGLGTSELHRDVLSPADAAGQLTELRRRVGDLIRRRRRDRHVGAEVEELDGHSRGRAVARCAGGRGERDRHAPHQPVVTDE